MNGAEHGVGLAEAPAAFEGAVGLLGVEQEADRAVQRGGVGVPMGGEHQGGVGGHRRFRRVAGVVGGHAAARADEAAQVGAAGFDRLAVAVGVNGVQEGQDVGGAVGVGLPHAFGI